METSGFFFFFFFFSFLFSLFSFLFSLFSFLFSLFSFLFSLFSFLFSLFSFLFSLFSFLFSLFSLFSFLFSLFPFLFSLFSFLFSLFSFLFSLFSFLFSLFLFLTIFFFFFSHSLLKNINFFLFSSQISQHCVGHHIFCNDVENDNDTKSQFPLMKMNPSLPHRAYLQFQHLYFPFLYSLLGISYPLGDAANYMNGSYAGLYKIRGEKYGEVWVGIMLCLLGLECKEVIFNARYLFPLSLLLPFPLMIRSNQTPQPFHCRSCHFPLWKGSSLFSLLFRPFVRSWLGELVFWMVFAHSIGGRMLVGLCVCCFS